MSCIKIIGLADGTPSRLDGQYVVEYDPSRPAPEDSDLTCHLVCTTERDQALQLTGADALELWRKSHGIRPDGRPNRPLTAFTVEIK